MKISDLDRVTRKLIFRAHVLVSRPSAEALRRLRTAVNEFDREHAPERSLLRAIFSFPGGEEHQKAAETRAADDADELIRMRHAFAATKTELLAFETLGLALVAEYDSDNRWPSVHALMDKLRKDVSPMNRMERSMRCHPGGLA